MRGFALRALRENGYVVIEARNAEEAVKLCEDNAAGISLLLTGTIMPGMNVEVLDSPPPRLPAFAGQ